MNRIVNLLFTLRLIFRRNWKNLFELLLIGILVWMAGSALLWRIESAAGNPDATWYNAFWSVFFTIAAPDFAELRPTTWVGEIVLTFLVFFSIAFVSFVTATIASMLVVNRLKEDKGMKKLQLKDHIVVCGWNANARSIIEEIINLASDSGRLKPIVLVADEEEHPCSDINPPVEFVHGNPSQEDVLERANTAECQTAVILSDTSGGRSMEDADARTILTVLTIESMNRAVYTVAEILDKSHVQHLKHANVDEIIISGDYASKMLANATLSHGLSAVITDLLSADEGSEFYRVPMPAKFIGKEFDETIPFFRSNVRAIPIGIMREEKPYLNPEVGFKLQEKDDLVVIALDQPKLD
jgi:voltage-gated potassium channel